MSILIKDMQMPKNCCICQFSSHDMCLINGKDAEDWFKERPSYCPLIELPENSYLIVGTGKFSSEPDDTAEERTKAVLEVLNETRRSNERTD